MAKPGVLAVISELVEQGLASCCSWPFSLSPRAENLVRDGREAGVAIRYSGLQKPGSCLAPPEESFWNLLIFVRSLPSKASKWFALQALLFLLGEVGGMMLPSWEGAVFWWQCPSHVRVLATANRWDLGLLGILGSREVQAQIAACK